MSKARCYTNQWGTIDFAARNGLEPTSYEANYGFLAHELSTDYKYSLAAVRQARNSQEAAKAFSGKYEYPGIPHLKSRYALARDIELNPKTGFRSPVPLGKGVTPRDVLNEITSDYGPLSGDMTLLETAAVLNPVAVKQPAKIARSDGDSDAVESDQTSDHDPIADIIEEDAAQQPANPRRLHLTPTMRRLMSGDLSALDPQNRPFSPNLLRMLMGGRARPVKGATRLHDIARPQGNRFER